ncbi:MAG: polyphosphate kinase 1 [Spirochaetales bacterium]|nr:polyphosphate kinase 1 [Spirochaetales bacterium]
MARLRRDSQIQLSNPNLFLNRELSWLAFNLRVLEEAQRKDNPLLERLKFLSITESNLDEFFMVRVAGLKQVVASSINEIQLDGKTAEETIQSISTEVHRLVELQYRCLRDITLGLQETGIEILENFEQLTTEEKKFSRKYFGRELFRVLTPMAIDPGHPFPHIIAGRLNQAVTLQSKKFGDRSQILYAIVEVPQVLPRFLEMPRQRSSAPLRFLPLEEVIKLNARDLFSGTPVLSMHGFTITRNSDLSIDEVASENLLSTIEDQLKNRRWGEAVRLNYRSGMPESIREFLRFQLDLDPIELYERPSLLNLSDLMEIYNRAPETKELRDVVFIPRNAVLLDKTSSIFKKIRKNDILLHHPYDSFQTVVDLLSSAARDPKVLAIKQTLYRAGKDSPIIQSLIEAAENGKQVTALVELKARFDEERNIEWARAMERHGIHVVYGLVGLKIHGKMLQIIRRENDEVKSYVHLSTGNYNPATARLYTDLALITADAAINQDVTNLFHSLTGYASVPRMTRIAAAPINLRETLSRLFQREINNALHKKKASITIKVNNIVDPEMILMIYRAARAGVKIQICVRSICCMKPGEELQNIRIVSVVGRFLEHSRIFMFENETEQDIYLSSADLMPRNLNRRVEVFFPIQDVDHKKRIVQILESYFRDNHNARVMLPDGNWRRLQPARGEGRFSAQRYFREEAMKEFDENEKARQEKRKNIFQPVMNPESILSPERETETA